MALYSHTSIRCSCYLIYLVLPFNACHLQRNKGDSRANPLKNSRSTYLLAQIVGIIVTSFLKPYLSFSYLQLRLGHGLGTNFPPG